MGDPKREVNEKHEERIMRIAEISGITYKNDPEHGELGFVVEKTVKDRDRTQEIYESSVSD